MIKRDLEERIKKGAVSYPVVSVTGPRQSGKTMLVKKIFSSWKYVNLETPEVRTFASEDPNSFLDQAEKMIIDEVQYVPELLSYIQVIVDEDKKRKFVITGSQNLLISGKVSQSLAGRVNIFNLFPLSFNELKHNFLIKKKLAEQMLNGFYPRIYSEKVEPRRWYGNYIQTYLERDVRQIKNIGDPSIFQKFLGLLAGRTGQILNLASLANDVGVTVPTIGSWISVLEASFIIVKLPPYYKSWNKRLTKSPKIHFLDSGLVCALLEISSSSELERHPLFGYIFESLVVSEFYKKMANKQERGRLYYWREKNGAEIDLLIDRGLMRKAIEIKVGATFSRDQVKNLLYFKKLTENAADGELKETDLELVYGGEEDEKRSEYGVRSWRNL